jgi:hypothetical protein
MPVVWVMVKKNHTTCINCEKKRVWSGFTLRVIILLWPYKPQRGVNSIERRLVNDGGGKELSRIDLLSCADV